MSDAGLIVHLTFDGNTNDSSGNGNDGTSASLTYAAGIRGQAGVFTGTGSDSVHFDPFAIDLAEYTLAGWFNASILSANAIMSLGENSGTRAAFQIGKFQPLSAGSVLAYDRPNGGNSGGQTFAWTGLNANEWYHFAVTRSGTNGELKLYLNGQLEMVNSLNGGDFNGLTDLVIGQNAPTLSTQRLYNGLLDDIRVYDAVISAGELAQISQISPVPEPASFAVWGLGVLGLAGIRHKRS
ncbi:MAG: LamG-like jellyroll fold domain-containing protein [Pirellulaceae bacterium]